MEKRELETPYNSNERFLHAIAVRLDAIIEQNNAIVDHLAKQSNVAVENVLIEEKKEAPVEEKPVEKKAPRKRPVKAKE